MFNPELLINQSVGALTTDVKSLKLPDCRHREVTWSPVSVCAGEFVAELIAKSLQGSWEMHSFMSADRSQSKQGSLQLMQLHWNNPDPSFHHAGFSLHVCVFF